MKNITIIRCKVKIHKLHSRVHPELVKNTKDFFFEEFMKRRVMKYFCEKAGH